MNFDRRAFMKMSGAFAATSIACRASAKDSEDSPNVVLIYGDDVGYGDVGAYGSELIPTPNIDSLARDGLLFTDGHCTAATCTPSRYALLTGVYGFRHGIRILSPNAPLTIPTSALTLPGVFKKAGYTTGVIGKWHLGLGKKGAPVDWNGDVKPGPLEVGFDYSFLLPSTNDRVPCVYLKNHRVLNLDPDDPLHVNRKPQEVNKKDNTKYPDGRKNRDAMTYYKSSHGHDHSIINGIGRIGYQSGGKAALWNDETMADVFVEEARSYIKKHRKERFFLYFSSQDIHVPRTPHPRFKGKSELSYRGDAMVQLDWSVGEIMKVLKKYKLEKNTIVIFTSDNGPVYDDGYRDGTKVKTFSKEVDRGHDGSGPYRGGKYQIYEGGTRVPLVIRWPDRIKPGKSDALVSQIDLLSSFAELLNVPIPENQACDSRSSLSAFLGKDNKGSDYIIEEAWANLALRQGNWKYISKPKSLYNLSDDPGELKNVISEHTQKAEEMAKKLAELRKSKGLRTK